MPLLLLLFPHHHPSYSVLVLHLGRHSPYSGFLLLPMVGRWAKKFRQKQGCFWLLGFSIQPIPSLSVDLLTIITMLGVTANIYWAPFICQALSSFWASLVAQVVKRRRFNSWVGKIPGEGNGYPLQLSCLENPMDREAWQATVHGVAKSQTQLEWQRSCNLCKLHFVSKVMEAKLLGDSALVTELQNGRGCIWIQAAWLTPELQV